MSTATLASDSKAKLGATPQLQISVGRLAPIEGTEDELMLAAAAGVPIRSQDPVDVVLLQTAMAMGDVRRLSHSEVQAATPITKMSVATVTDASGEHSFRILRGDPKAVLDATTANESLRNITLNKVYHLRRKGFRSMAVAMAQLDANGEPESWKMLGIIPLQALRGKKRIADTPTDWVYIHLWDPALRLMHWTAVACIVVLIGTGYMIATPFLAPGTAAPQPYLMGWIRLFHYSAAWILIATAVVRIADLFMSPYPYARWRALWPIQDKAEARATVDVLKGYLFFRTHRNPTWIGLNPLQAITYTAVYGLALLMVATGLAMYGLYDPSQWPYSWFQWLNWWLGADTVRWVHYVGMWLFLIFIPAHVYLSARSDTIDRGGAISSMINGGIWVRKCAPAVDATHYNEPDANSGKQA